MFRKRVTCPETAHLEEIGYVESPLGLLIARCTRFDRCAVDCPRTCAARMDRRDYPTVQDKLRSGSLLVVRSCLR